jgi:hypothetical protein
MTSKSDATKRSVLIDDDEAAAMCANLVCIGGGGGGRNSVTVYGAQYADDHIIEHHYDAATGTSRWYKKNLMPGQIRQW